MAKTTVGEWGHLDDMDLRIEILSVKMRLEALLQEQRNRGKIKHARYTRDERKQQVLRVLRDGKIYTTSQIAARLEMSSSGHLREIICELFRDGKVLGYAQNTVAAHPIFYWYLQETLPLPFPNIPDVAPCDQIRAVNKLPF